MRFTENEHVKTMTRIAALEGFVHAHVPKLRRFVGADASPASPRVVMRRGVYAGGEVRELPDGADLEPILDEAVDYSSSPIDDCGYHDDSLEQEYVKIINGKIKNLNIFYNKIIFFYKSILF